MFGKRALQIPRVSPRLLVLVLMERGTVHIGTYPPMGRTVYEHKCGFQGGSPEAITMVRKPPESGRELEQILKASEGISLAKISVLDL